MYLLTSISFLIFTKFLNTCADINMTIYKNMPPLYDFDNYDHCFSNELSTYCTVFAKIVSNKNSDVWHNIEELSQDLFHNFRHENLFFGVCIEQCNELRNQLTPLKWEQHFQNRRLENEITNYYKKVHKREDAFQNRLLYESLVNKCLNYRIQRKYNLTLLTSIEYCETSEKTKNIDSLDIIFYVIIAILVLLNIFSSLYDYRLKCGQPLSYRNNEHYKQKIKASGFRLLTSFSICRNYYRITSLAPNQNLKNSDLKFTYAFRVFTIIIVILAHLVMINMTLQIQNPEFFEKLYHQTSSIMLQNGSAIIQIFFVLAGFLLKLKFEEYKMITPDSSYKMGLFVYIHGFLSRYLRFLPSLALVILFNATLLIRLEDGPFWRHITEAEYVFCREYWWKNVFLINNFMLKESCAHHTWFLAADMQLYELFLLTIIITAKFPSLRQPLYVLIAIFALLVPGFITYFYKLEAIHYLKPESYRYLFFKDVDTFYLTYLQFYCNLGGYLVGFICAEIYMKYIHHLNPIKVKYIKYQGVIKFEITLLTIALLITISLLASGILVVNRSIEKPSLWLALYASLYRNMWAILGGFILLCMLFKFGWIVYEIACLSIFRILGKISYQTYLWHLTILRLLFGYYRQPLYINVFYVICHLLLGFVFSNLIGFIMTMCVEYPIGQIVRYVLRTKIEKDYKFDDDKSGNSHEMQPNIIESCRNEM